MESKIITDQNTLALAGWKILRKDDQELQAALKAWSWKGSENKDLLLKAWAALSIQGVSLNDFLRGLKYAVLVDDKWNLSNVSRYSKSPKTTLDLKGTWNINYRLADYGLAVGPDAGLAEAIARYRFDD